MDMNNNGIDNKEMLMECFSQMEERIGKIIEVSLLNINVSIKRIKEENTRLFSNYGERINKVEQSVKRWNITGICIVVFCVFVLASEMFLFKRNTELTKRDAIYEQAIEQIRNELKETIKIELNGGGKEESQEE